jgi:hypothetical protein
MVEKGVICDQLAGNGRKHSKNSRFLGRERECGAGQFHVRETI